MDACGDSFAINAFSSLKRDRVFLSTCKSFDEPMNAVIERRSWSPAPASTRAGAGIRHASAGLSGQAAKRRLLLVITDGKPNDLDHYEGRHGIEDSARAARGPHDGPCRPWHRRGSRREKLVPAHLRSGAAFR